MQVLDVLILYIHRFIGLLIFSGHIDIHSPYIPRVHSFFRSFTHSFLVIHRQLRWNQRADTHQCFCSQCYRDWTVDRTCRHCLQNTRFLWRWQLPPGRDSCCCCAVWSRCLEEPAVWLHVAIRELILGPGVLTGQGGGCVPPRSADCLAILWSQLTLAVSWAPPNTESISVFRAFCPHDLNCVVSSSVDWLLFPEHSARPFHQLFCLLRIVLHFSVAIT